MKPARPSFERPPLLEQAITVMFKPLDGFSLGDFGLFWQRIVREFPRSESAEPIDNIVEHDAFRPQQLQIRLIQANALPRCFFLSDDGAELVQLQPDRFSFNWRGGSGKPYPRFEATRARFTDLFSEFCRFVSDRNLGEIDITQCELANVNMVPVKDFGETFADAPAVFRAPSIPAMDFLLPEAYISNTQYQMLKDVECVGRLHVVLTPVVRVDDSQRAYRLELTARGAPLNGAADGVSEFFDMARDAINSAFLGSTTEWAHSRWGLKDG